MSEENKQYTFENETYRKTYWHTCSHILAQAMKRLHPEVKLAIGPSIDNGFYYDFDTPEPFSETQLEELEAEMRKICKEKLKLERFELPRAEAIKFMEDKAEPYKVELINDLPEDAVISFYKQGDFTGGAIPAVRPFSGFTAWPSPKRTSWTNISSALKRPRSGTTGNWARNWASLCSAMKAPASPSSFPRAWC